MFVRIVPVHRFTPTALPPDYRVLQPAPASLARRMKHKGPRIAWANELLMHAQNQPDDASDWIEWHPFGDVLRIITAAHGESVVTRSRLTAAAAALGRLAEQKRVRVKRTGRNFDSYRLTKAGGVRALELIEHGGVTAKTAKRLAEADKRNYSPQRRIMSRVYQEDPKTGECVEVGTYVVPTVAERIRGLQQSRRALERELFDDDDLAAALADHDPAAVKRAAKIIRELSGIRWQLSTRKQHERERLRARDHNARVWPQVRQSLIDAGHPIAPDADWWALPRELHPLAYPPLIEWKRPGFSLAGLTDW